MYYQTTWETSKTQTREVYKRYSEACYLDEENKLHKLPRKKRSQRKKATKEAVKQYNQRMRIRNLTRKINENFAQDDNYLTLTYGEEKPEVKEADELFNKFIRLLRREFQKRGRTFRWIGRTEVGAKNNALHHHLLIPKLSDNAREDRELIRELWHKYAPGSLVKIIPLYTEEFSRLASYFCKRSKYAEQTGMKQNYRCSRNLREPKETHKRVKANSWREEPVVPAGWMLDKNSLEVGVNPLTGTGYQFYRLIKLDQEEKHEEQEGTRRCKKREVRHSLDGRQRGAVDRAPRRDLRHNRHAGNKKRE